jgi:hypothetical protein
MRIHLRCQFAPERLALSVQKNFPVGWAVQDPATRWRKGKHDPATVKGDSGPLQELPSMVDLVF